MAIEVPFLSKEAIEQDAESLLRDFTKMRSTILTLPIPIEDVVEKHLKLSLEFDDTHRRFGIPRANRTQKEGPDILGAIFFDDRLILIDESLDPEQHPYWESRYRFTLAHEGGGHWRLHRPLFDEPINGEIQTSNSQSPSFLCRSRQRKESAEWQADYYASCLLMPRSMVFKVWKEKYGSIDPIVFEQMKDREIAKHQRGAGFRRLGEIMPDVLGPNPTNLFRNIARQFAPIFGVSPEAMQYRLQELGLFLLNSPANRKFASN